MNGVAVGFELLSPGDAQSIAGGECLRLHPWVANHSDDRVDVTLPRYVEWVVSVEGGRIRLSAAAHRRLGIGETLELTVRPRQQLRLPWQTPRLRIESDNWRGDEQDIAATVVRIASGRYSLACPLPVVVSGGPDADQMPLMTGTSEVLIDHGRPVAADEYRIAWGDRTAQGLQAGCVLARDEVNDPGHHFWYTEIYLRNTGMEPAEFEYLAVEGGGWRLSSTREGTGTAATVVSPSIGGADVRRIRLEPGVRSAIAGPGLPEQGIELLPGAGEVRLVGLAGRAAGESSLANATDITTGVIDVAVAP